MFVLPVSMKYPVIRNNVTSIRSAPKNGVDRMEVVLLLKTLAAETSLTFVFHHAQNNPASIHFPFLLIGQ